MSAEPEILNRESAVIRGSRLSLERGRTDPLFRSSLKSSGRTAEIASALNDNGRVQAHSGNHSNGTGVIENGIDLTRSSDLNRAFAFTGMEREPTVGTCAISGQPLTQPGQKHERLRHLVSLGFLNDSQQPERSEAGRRLIPGPLKYDHFEVEVGADGFPAELGAGAMAITYRARDTVLNSVVALKVIDRTVAQNPGARSRFLREARAAAQIRHPNVARVSHYGEQDGECFYVMEVVEGETLEAKVRREGPLSLALALEIIEQVARALAAAEACGVVHRDIKPSNIMLESDPGGCAPIVKVIDYGIAKILNPEAERGAEQTRTGFIGTPAFASPEQFAPSDQMRIDTRSDMYSLGATFWYLLSGRVPFVGRTLRDVAAKQAEELPLEQLKNTHVPARVIALLPFEHLSATGEDTYFTVGMQDEITGDLAKLAGMKVIGSQSTRSYLPGKERNLHAIGRDLGVWHLLEGTVSRDHDQMRVALHLVDLRDSGRPWTETYERPMKDVFALQSEITQAVVARLKARLSPNETVALNEPPTADLRAYDLYLRAQAIDVLVKDTAEWASVAQQRISFLDQAVERDPKFVLAYCELTKAYDILYLTRQVTPVENRTVDHRALAEAALAKARRIQPDIGPVHLALAYHFLWANNDLSQAHVEIDLARRTMPNSAELETTAGAIARRQSRWDDDVRALERAVALEPRAAENLFALANTYRLMRRYDRFDSVMTRLLGVLPPDRSATQRVFRTFGPLESEGELGPLRAAVATVTPEEDASGAIRDLHNLILALWNHDPASVSRISAQAAETTFVFNGVKYPKSWYEGLAARMRGDKKGAQAAFAAARLEVEKAVLADASDGRALSLLAMIDAGLGRQEQAVQEAEHACDLVTFENSGPSAPIVRSNLAVVYAWNGQLDLAISTLEPLVNRPAGTNLPAQPTYGDFRWNPLWDPLRSNPRFQALAQRLVPLASSE